VCFVAIPDEETGSGVANLPDKPWHHHSEASRDAQVCQGSKKWTIKFAGASLRCGTGVWQLTGAFTVALTFNLKTALSRVGDAGIEPATSAV
jgi:hypothetical protein